MGKINILFFPAISRIETLRDDGRGEKAAPWNDDVTRKLNANLKNQLTLSFTRCLQ